MKLNLANWITIVRIFLIIPFVCCMLKIKNPVFGNAMRYTAVFVYLTMVFGDALDGYLARVKKQATKLGSFLDPVADKLLITCACLLLVSQRSNVEDFPLPPTVVVLIIAKDLLILIGFLIVYFMTSQVYIAPVLIGKVANDMQLSMVAAILLGPEISSVLPWWIWLLRLLWWFAAGAAILTTLIYLRMAIQYIEKYEQNLANNSNK